jgi:hypothetical protein
MGWSGNIFQIFNNNAGSGTLRGMQIGDASDYFEVIGAASGGSPKFAIRRTATTTASGLLITNASGFTGSSGTQYGTSIVSTINQTSTAGFTDLLINRTQTAVGSGTQAFIDAQVAGSSYFKVDNNGKLTLQATNTAGGTTGNRTINKPTGTVNVAAAGTAITVTNSTVSTSSIVYAIARTNDTTCAVKNAVPGSGTVTITMTAACTAETSVGFMVIN